MSQKIKVHILFDFVDCAWGGGNQFLKAVKDYLINNNSYVDSYSEADVILINFAFISVSISGEPE